MIVIIIIFVILIFIIAMKDAKIEELEDKNNLLKTENTCLKKAMAQEGLIPKRFVGDSECKD